MTAEPTPGPRHVDSLEVATVAEVTAVLNAAEGPLTARDILNLVCDTRGVSRTRLRGAWSRSGNTTDLWPISKVDGALEYLVNTERAEVYTGAHPDTVYLLPFTRTHGTTGRILGARVDTRWFTRTDLAAAGRAALAQWHRDRQDARSANAELAERLYGRFGILAKADDEQITATLTPERARRLLADADTEAAQDAAAALASDTGPRIVLTLFNLSERHRLMRRATSEEEEGTSLAVMRTRGQYEGALEMAAAITGTRQDDLVAAVRAYRKAERAADAAARDGLRRSATDGP